MTRPRSPSTLTSLALLSAMSVLCVLAGACQGRAAARREGDRVTAEAEAKAQETTLTSAELAGPAPAADVDDDTKAAFRLEQSDYRGRLQVALDQLDRAVLRARAGHGRAAPVEPRRLPELRARRALLKADLDAVDRSTEQDWATLRTKLERDLDPEPRR